jgi:hypothetical protein
LNMWSKNFQFLVTASSYGTKYLRIIIFSMPIYFKKL